MPWLSAEYCSPLSAPQTKSFISVNARNVKMAHSAGRSNGVVADENEMESECVFLLVDYAASDAGGGSQQY